MFSHDAASAILVSHKTTKPPFCWWPEPILWTMNYFLINTFFCSCEFSWFLAREVKTLYSKRDSCCHFRWRFLFKCVHCLIQLSFLNHLDLGWSAYCVLVPSLLWKNILQQISKLDHKNILRTLESRSTDEQIWKRGFCGVLPCARLSCLICGLLFVAPEMERTITFI